MFIVIAFCPAQLRAEVPADSLSHQLNEVVVTARQPATRLEGTTLVSTIAGSPLALSGNTLDVLGQLPMIKVDDEVVSVHGKGAPLIYIDRRPVSDISELRMLSSRDIKRVELIMAPGAEYEATAGAVIRIITRGNFIKGLSFENEAQGKCSRVMSGYEQLGMRYFFSSGTELFVNGFFSHNNSKIKGHTVNRLVYDGLPVEVGSSQNTRKPSDNGGGKIGFNHVSGKQSFGAYYKLNCEHGDFSNRGSEWYQDETPLERDIYRRISGQSHYGQAYYDNEFGGRYRLHFDGTAVSKKADSDNNTVYPSGTPESVSSEQTRRSNLFAGKLTLSLPMGKGRLSVGAEDSYTTNDIDYRMKNETIESYIPSSETKVRQLSSAFFGSYRGSFGRFSFDAGLRYEHKRLKYRVDGRDDAGLSRHDNLITPDVTVGFSIDETKSLSLSYKSFTELPPYSQLTDGLNYTGRHEIEGGNPALRDGRCHQLQLAGTWGDFMLQATFRRSIDSYGFIKRVYPSDDLQLLFQPINFNVSEAWLYLVWQKRVGFWSTDVTLWYNPQWMKLDGNRYDKPLYGYYFDNMFSPGHDWMLTANIYGQSGGNIHTQQFEPKWFVMDLSVKKMFLDKTLGVRLSVNNIFNTSRDGWRLKSFGVDMKKSQSYDNRYIALTVTYNFQPRKSEYKGKDAAGEEFRRL